MAERWRIGLVLVVCALLGACQATAPRRSATASVAAESPPASAQDDAHATITAPTLHDHPPKSKARAVASAHDSEPAQGDVPDDGDVWQRMRESFALPGCDYRPGVQHWTRRYAASPSRFAGQLAQMLPAIDYTLGRLRDASIPGEFALLPIVESHYHPFPGSQAQPAGMWQMIAATARSAGLRVDAWFDGRLNLAASTSAAITLLDRYAEQFGEDWRLVAFAYNAGEYRVRRALERHTPDASAASLHALGVPRTSLEYLDKLLALSCLIREPDRVGLELPELPSEQRLVELELDGTVGLPLARALSGMSREEFERRNGGMLKGRTPPGDRIRLLVPAHRLEAATRALAGIPAARRLEWRQQRLASVDLLADIADHYDLDPDTLRALNGLEPASTPITDAQLWLPGPGHDEGRATGSSTVGNTIHVVRSGDSLWAIARRHGLTVAELLRYNQLNSTQLKPGQRLRLTAP